MLHMHAASNANSGNPSSSKKARSAPDESVQDAAAKDHDVEDDSASDAEQQISEDSSDHGNV